MNRILKIVAIPAALASIAMALPAAAGDHSTGTADRANLVAQAAANGNASPNSSAASSPAIAELRSHGARFQAAIRLIQAEAKKPDWGWEEGCGHNSSEQSESLNW